MLKSSENEINQIKKNKKKLESKRNELDEVNMQLKEEKSK